MKNRKFRFLLLLLLPTMLTAQDASKIVDGLISKMNLVRDYSAHATIKSDIPLIRILPVKADVFFKQKDKFRVKTTGIAILPRQSVTDLAKLIKRKDGFTPILTGSENIGSVKTSIVTLLPTADTGDVVLVKIWVDAANELVLKSQTTTRSNGTIAAEYSYGSQKAFGLPDEMVFTIDVKKFKIPKGIATDLNRTSTGDAEKTAGKTGKIYISLTGYQVNKGISDEVFR